MKKGEGKREKIAYKTGKGLEIGPKIFAGSWKNESHRCREGGGRNDQNAQYIPLDLSTPTDPQNKPVRVLINKNIF